LPVIRFTDSDSDRDRESLRRHPAKGLVFRNNRANQPGGLGVPSSNLGAPTNKIKDLFGFYLDNLPGKSPWAAPGQIKKPLARWSSFGCCWIAARANRTSMLSSISN
jgi:hypothetical protein